MKRAKLSDFHRGWIIGDFEPSLIKTPDFEVALLTHKAGENWPKHYHKKAVEYNVLVQGSMHIAGETLSAGDVFWFDKFEVADPVFIEDCTVLCVKVPSVPGDKYEVFQS